MPTIIYPSPIFGPIKSRRLGVSLGINLLPSDGKACTFDCIYCECGYNSDRRPNSKLPTREQVHTALESKLRQMKDNGEKPDVLTFAGNGEPTIHPHFPEIISDTIQLRDRYFPNAKVSVLTNGTRILDDRVFDALCMVDNNIVKLDTVDNAYIQLVDRPNTSYNLSSLIERMKAFNGHIIIQTMFMLGTDDEGRSTDNTQSCHIEPWITAVKYIAPREVMIYTIDREPPSSHLRKAPREVLDNIVEQLRMQNIKATASY